MVVQSGYYSSGVCLSIHCCVHSPLPLPVLQQLDSYCGNGLVGLSWGGCACPFIALCTAPCLCQKHCTSVCADTAAKC